MSETDLKRSITRSLRACGCMVVRVQAGSFRGAGGWAIGAEPGSPDLVVLSRDATTTWIEVKVDDGEPSESQVKWHARARAMGHRVAVVRSVSEAIKAVTGR